MNRPPTIKATPMSHDVVEPESDHKMHKALETTAEPAAVP